MTTPPIPETVHDEIIPRVWLGCLSCYNSGLLVGDWYDAATADEITIARLHRDVGAPLRDCEEYLALDHEYLPVRGEPGPHEAAEWGRLIMDVPADERGAFLAWCETQDQGEDLPTVEDFHEAYCGTWDSLKDYAFHLAEDCAVFVDVPEHLTQFIDYDAWTRQVASDQTEVDALDASGFKTGEVYVFRCI